MNEGDFYFPSSVFADQQAYRFFPSFVSPLSNLKPYKFVLHRCIWSGCRINILLGRLEKKKLNLKNPKCNKRSGIFFFFYHMWKRNKPDSGRHGEATVWWRQINLLRNDNNGSVFHRAGGEDRLVFVTTSHTLKSFSILRPELFTVLWPTVSLRLGRPNVTPVRGTSAGGAPTCRPQRRRRRCLRMDIHENTHTHRVNSRRGSQCREI